MRVVLVGHLKLLRGLKLRLLPLMPTVLMGQRLHLQMAERQVNYQASQARMAAITPIRMTAVRELKQLRPYPLLLEDILVQALLRLVGGYLGRSCLLIIPYGSTKCHCKHIFSISLDLPPLSILHLSLHCHSWVRVLPIFFLAFICGPFSYPCSFFPSLRYLFALYLAVCWIGLDPSSPSWGLFCPWERGFIVALLLTAILPFFLLPRMNGLG